MKDTTLADRIRSMRTAKGLRKTDLAKLVGVSRSSVTNWENGTVDTIDGDNLMRVASVLECTPSFLLHGKNKGDYLENDIQKQCSAKQSKVPVISWVQAGEFMSIVDNFAPGHADEFIWCDKPRRHTFALIVNGDSMEPEFMEGDRIVVEPEEEPRHGRYVIAKNGDTATLKQLIQDGNEFFLKPLNNRYPIKPLGDATIVGVVTHKYKTFI